MKSSGEFKMPSLDRLKDKVLKIILLQGRGSKRTKESPDKHHDDKLKNILEEVDQVAKAIFMTGLPKGDGVSPTRETSLRKKQLENERQVIEKTLERLSQLEDEKDKKAESTKGKFMEDITPFKDYLEQDIRDVRDLQRFLANLREQIKMNKSLVYKQKKIQSEWFAQEKQNQEYIADDINFFIKRNGMRS